MPRDDSLLYDLLRKGTQFAALGLDVLCGKDSTYQRHAVHAGALELQNVLLVDAANSYHRHISRVCRGISLTSVLVWVANTAPTPR